MATQHHPPALWGAPVDAAGSIIGHRQGRRSYGLGPARIYTSAVRAAQPLQCPLLVGKRWPHWPQPLLPQCLFWARVTRLGRLRLGSWGRCRHPSSLHPARYVRHRLPCHVLQLLHDNPPPSRPGQLLIQIQALTAGSVAVLHVGHQLSHNLQAGSEHKERVGCKCSGPARVAAILQVQHLAHSMAHCSALRKPLRALASSLARMGSALEVATASSLASWLLSSMRANSSSRSCFAVRAEKGGGGAQTQPSGCCVRS